MALDIDTSGYETSEESFPPSTIETIDEALTRFVKELNIFASTQEGWKQVPVIWTSAERSFQIWRTRIAIWCLEFREIIYV